MATRVSQGVINEIRNMGMEAAVKKYMSGGGSPEFNEAIQRFYPNVQKNKNTAATVQQAASTADSTGGSTSLPTNRTRRNAAASRPTRDVGNVDGGPRTPPRAAVERRLGGGNNRSPRNFGEWASNNGGRPGARNIVEFVRQGRNNRSSSDIEEEAPQRRNGRGPRNFGEWVGRMNLGNGAQSGTREPVRGKTVRKRKPPTLRRVSGR